VSDFRPPDDDPGWPESDLGPDEERRSWLEPHPPSDAHEPESTPEEPADTDWSLPWDAPARDAPDPDAPPEDSGQDEGAAPNDTWRTQDEWRPAPEPPPSDEWRSEPAQPPSDEWRSEPEPPPSDEWRSKPEPARSEDRSEAEPPPSDEWRSEPAASESEDRSEAEPEPQIELQSEEQGQPEDQPAPEAESPSAGDAPSRRWWERPREEPQQEEPWPEAPWVEGPRADNLAAEEPQSAPEPMDEPAPEPMDEPLAEEPQDEPVAYAPMDEPTPEPMDEPLTEEPQPERWEPEDAGVGAPVPESAPPTTTFGSDDGWDPRLDGERRRPTTAEQAVPWMIGVILALAGMVIVLLALIFTFPNGLIGSASPTPTASPSEQPSTGESTLPSTSGEPAPSLEPTATAAPTATPTPMPEYGALEMVYLGRPSALAPIYLLRRDFSENADPTIMAQADQGISDFAWSPDGRVGAAIIAGRGVALTPGESARALADGVTEISWGWDSQTLYAVRVTKVGGNDSTEILQIDFASGDTKTLATITYPHPVTAPDPKLKEAQFIDDGGLVRLFAMADGNLELWVLGAPATYRIDPGDGSVTEAPAPPILWAPDGRQRISLKENGDGTTTLSLLGPGEERLVSVKVTGLVSHVRWAPSNNEIVFTLGHLSNAGGVRQDLYVWDLVDGKAPMALTSDGVSFGASWVGASANWMPPRS